MQTQAAHIKGALGSVLTPAPDQTATNYKSQQMIPEGNTKHCSFSFYFSPLIPRCVLLFFKGM